MHSYQDEGGGWEMERCKIIRIHRTLKIL